MRSRARRVFRRHEVWWCSIPDDHARSPEFSDGPAGRPHPFLILSTNEITGAGLAIGVPGTSGAKGESRWFLTVSPTELIVKDGDRPLAIDTCFLFQHLRSVRLGRLSERAGMLKGMPRVNAEEILRALFRLEEANPLPR